MPPTTTRLTALRLRTARAVTQAVALAVAASSLGLSAVAGREPSPFLTAHPIVSTDPATIAARYQAALHLFEVDETHRFPLVTGASALSNGISTHPVSYPSPAGGTVTGYLVRPVHGEDLPGLIFVAPLPAADLLDRARGLASLGMVVLVIDPPFIRRGGEPITFSLRDREEQIQFIRDLRRGVDALTTEGADPDRLAVIGYSWGCAMSAQLAGVEHRIGSYVLMFCDGGVLEHFTGPDDAGGPLDALPEDGRKAWIEAMEPIEPLYFIPYAAPSALLFQSGERDDEILRADAERLQALASEPREVRWYDSGHDPTPDAPEVWCDQAVWLKERIDVASSSLPECDEARG